VGYLELVWMLWVLGCGYAIGLSNMLKSKSSDDRSIVIEVWASC
jgi:hypothetical protein